MKKCKTCKHWEHQGHKMGCRQYAYDNYTDKEQGEMCLMDYEAREWQV